MYFNCKLDLFREAVVEIKSAFTAKLATKEYHEVLLKTTSNAVVLSIWNKEFDTQIKVEAEVFMKKKVAVNINILNNIVDSLYAEDICFSITEDNRLKIESGSYTGVINTFDTDKYPSRAVVSKYVEFSMLFEELRNMINGSISYEADMHSGSPLHCILMRIKDKKLTLTGTDGHRFSRIEQEVNGNASAKILVNGEILKSIARVLYKGDNYKDVKVKISENRLELGFDNVSIGTCLYAGNYPDIEDRFKMPKDAYIIVNRLSLLSSVERALVLTLHEKNDRYVLIESINLSTKVSIRTRIGNSKEEIDTISRKNDFSIMINGNYLIQVLNSLMEEQIQLSVSKDRNTCLIRNKENDSYLYCIIIYDKQISMQ